MKFQPGDKVRFLNTSGGGVVTKIISPSLVSVAIEDGFEIPTLINELIRVESKEPASGFFNKTEETFEKEKLSTDDQNNDDILQSDENEGERLFPLRKGKNDKLSNIWIAFRPHDQKWLITGLVDICILNPTDFDIIYSFLQRQADNQYIGADYDVIPAVSGIVIATVTREALPAWINGSVQMLFYKELLPRIIVPVNAVFQLKASRFLKEDNYITNTFITEKALMVNLSAVVESVSEPEENEGYEPVSDSKIILEKPRSLIDKHRIAPFEAEVDLHISALKDDYSKLSQFDILKFQKDYFLQCIESVLESQYRRIIFIHGIGNGTLRNTITDILKQYEEFRVQNASFKKYGYGAIEVINTLVK